VRHAPAPALALLAVLAASNGGASSTTESLSLSSDLRVRVAHGRSIELEVRRGDRDDWAAVASRVATATDAGAIAAANAGRAPGDPWIRVPLALLSTEFRSLVLRNLFPRDRMEGTDWIHVARSGALPTYDEGLWQVAEWFTGSGPRFAEIMEANGLDSPELRAGQSVRIPEALLDAAFRVSGRSDDGALEYRTDGVGPHAVYRLRPGEALYSSVVVRFTGRTAADDVHAIAREIGERSAIRDVRDIPAGYEVKIPLDLLEPQFLPATDPRRLEAEAREAELARALARDPVPEPPRGLAGVWIVLDPGHGGRDLGTIKNGVWEHDYVYDVACRVKHKLEQRTAARVLMTLEDRETGCDSGAGDRLVANQQGTILTDPPFLARLEGEAQIGVNLRWYLANSIYRRAVSNGIDSDRVVFLSLHADSRHASLRGLMVYVPGAAHRTRTYGHDTRTYRQYREVREKPHVRFSHDERVRSEAVSRELGRTIVETFRRQKLPVQPYQPVRDKIIRGRSEWVPAVLRGNEIPTKLLVEMLNLANHEDAELLGKSVARDRLAEALVEALLLHFGERPGAGGATAAAAVSP
jgi:N-acetylmuramoyl-L-alanine amidase